MGYAVLFCFCTSFILKIWSTVDLFLLKNLIFLQYTFTTFSFLSRALVPNSAMFLKFSCNILSSFLFIGLIQTSAAILLPYSFHEFSQFLMNFFLQHFFYLAFSWSLVVFEYFCFLDFFFLCFFYYYVVFTDCNG